MTIEPSPEGSAPPAWLARFPRVFRHYNYRLFFAGQLVTLLGTWIQSVALAWLVYRLTHSLILLGVVSFVSQAPIFFITPFAGLIADRNDRRTVFMVTRPLSRLQAAILTVLTLTTHVDVHGIIGLALV